jgi:hypothetical protein
MTTEELISLCEKMMKTKRYRRYYEKLLEQAKGSLSKKASAIEAAPVAEDAVEAELVEVEPEPDPVTPPAKKSKSKK